MEIAVRATPWDNLTEDQLWGAKYCAFLVALGIPAVWRRKRNPEQLWYVWSHPRLTAFDVARVAALMENINKLTRRVTCPRTRPEARANHETIRTDLTGKVDYASWLPADEDPIDFSVVIAAQGDRASRRVLAGPDVWAKLEQLPDEVSPSG